MSGRYPKAQVTKQMSCWSDGSVPPGSRGRGRRRRYARAPVLPVVACLAALAWGLPGPLAGQGRNSPEPTSELLVLAAASLADVLPAMGELWMGRSGSDGKGPTVTFSFDATSRLARQAEINPAADVFVGADIQWVNWLGERGRLVPSAVRRIAGNTLVVVVPASSGSPLSASLGLVSLGRVALAGENVPAGRYARQALEAEGVWETVRSRVVSGNSVRSALEWAARGEVDAAVVYETDAHAEKAVRVAFAFPESSHLGIGYFAVPLAESPTEAGAFVEFLASPQAQRLFRDAGFTVPPMEQEPVSVGGSPTGGEGELRLPAGPVPSIASAIRISVLVSMLATLLGTPAAVALGWLLARRSFRGKTALSTVVMAPLVVPPVVTGFLLLSLFGSNGPAGRLLAEIGLTVPFTLVGAALAALVVGFPLYVISVRNAFEAVDPRYEELSTTLSVPPLRTFTRITLPLALPGIAAGAMLAFARSLGEFGATVVLAGNVEGNTRTIALAVYTLLESPGDQWRVWTLAGASVAVSLLALVAFEFLSRRQKVRMEGRNVRG